MSEHAIAHPAQPPAIQGTPQEYISKARAANTFESYRRDWAHFSSWAEQNGVPALPADPQAVAAYIADLARRGLKASTIQRRLASISRAHKTAQHPSPTTHPVVRGTWDGIRRTHGTRQEGKRPILAADLRRMLETLPDTLLGVRDRALLLVGFAGAFRRSELVSIDVEDLEFREEGIVVTLRRSKTDQDGEGRRVGVPYGSHPLTCPVRSLRAWLEASGINAGPVFRSITRHGHIQPRRLSDKAVALVVKRTARAAGIDPGDVSGHSLRAGLATSAAAAGASERIIMAQTGHRSERMVRRYIREGSLFRENAAAMVGL